jgi:hypothetical protein
LIGARGDRSIPEDDALATERGRRGASQQQQEEEEAAASERTATVRPRPKLGEARRARNPNPPQTHGTEAPRAGERRWWG